MAKLATWGNELYTGKRSYDFVGRRKLWFAITGALVLLSILLPVMKGGFNLGIDFRGGTEFQVAGITQTDESAGEKAVQEVVPDATTHVTRLNAETVRVQTVTMEGDQSDKVKENLASAYGTQDAKISVSFIGPTWGADVSKQALIGLVVFVVLVSLLMAFYFRTWKMSAAAIVGLLAVVVITAGVYSASGFEVTPSAIIGFLTILSYALYDTVVVFDKVRENTHDHTQQATLTFGEQVNRAINQTLVRSINTSVVAILPVGAILFIGAGLLGAGTLKDLSLALFVGIIVSALSTLFVAAPLYATFRIGEPAVKAHDAAILEARGEETEEAAVVSS